MSAYVHALVSSAERLLLKSMGYTDASFYPPEWRALHEALAPFCTGKVDLWGDEIGASPQPSVGGGGAPVVSRPSVNGGVPQFLWIEGEATDRVPERYKNWLTDDQWRQMCDAKRPEIENGTAQKVMATRQELSLGQRMDTLPPA